MPTDKTIALLKQFSHRDVNTDAMAGFEARMQSARARAPEHLTHNRWADWESGRKAAELYLETRRTYFSGETPDGTKVEIVRKGWVTRGPVVSQLARKGVVGDVRVTYVDGSRGGNARTVMCGI